MEFPEWILKNVVTTNMHCQVLTSDPIVHSLQFLAEISPLHVEVENFGVVDKYGEWSLGQRCCWLPQNLVQHYAVHFWHLTVQTNSILCHTRYKLCWWAKTTIQLTVTVWWFWLKTVVSIPFTLLCQCMITSWQLQIIFDKFNSKQVTHHKKHMSEKIDKALF